MRYRFTRAVRFMLRTAAVVVLAVAGCAQGESADLNPDTQETIAAAVDATVAVRSVATLSPMRVPSPATDPSAPTPTQAPTATPSPSPTPRPTATPVPTYTPQLADYIAALGTRYSRSMESAYLDLFDDYVASYTMAVLLGSLPGTKDQFVRFVQSHDLLYGEGSLYGEVGDQLRRVHKMYQSGAAPEWVLRVEQPKRSEDATIVCLPAVGMLEHSMSPLVSQYFDTPDCLELFVRYIASPDVQAEGFIAYVRTALGLGALGLELD